MLTLTWATDISFEKLRPETSGEILKTPSLLCFLGYELHRKPVMFFNIFSGDLHVDALIIGLY